MPYIVNEDREKLENGLTVLLDGMTKLKDDEKLTAGTLNYLFTRLALDYIELKGLRYQNCNDIMGALDGCSKELYRRIFGPYEDKAIEKNGDLNGFQGTRDGRLY